MKRQEHQDAGEVSGRGGVEEEEEGQGATLPPVPNPSRCDAGVQSDVLHLVIVWSHDQPHRVGEAAAVEGPAVLGRGGPLEQDPAPRLVFYRQRPTGSVEAPPLEGLHISRFQLELGPMSDGRLWINSVGCCPLLINGEAVMDGIARVGDTVTLQDGLMMLVVRRQPVVGHRPGKDWANFPFGEADSHGIVGESPAVWRLRVAIGFAAEARGHVLIRGESGVGKELAARAVHKISRRRSCRFMAQSAATLREGSIDEELFGKCAGRIGLLEMLDGGTLVLDELGDLPPHLQGHLLRMLDQGGEFQRVGEARVRRSDVRVIATTNRPLDSLRPDLLARFPIRVTVPPLRERREDIPLLVRHILAEETRSSPTLIGRYFERRNGRTTEPRIDPSVIEALVQGSYPSNLRELTRLIWVAMGSSPSSSMALTPEFAAELSQTAGVYRGSTGGYNADSIGVAQIKTALDLADGNIAYAAQQLGLTGPVLYKQMRQHGITVSSLSKKSAPVSSDMIAGRIVPGSREGRRQVSVRAEEPASMPMPVSGQVPRGSTNWDNNDKAAEQGDCEVGWSRRTG